MNEQLARQEQEEEEQQQQFMKLTSNFHNSHTSEHCGILSIDIFILHLFCVAFTPSFEYLLSISEDDENDDSDGSESNEDELTVKHKV